jgi:ribosomal protein L21E
MAMKKKVREKGKFKLSRYFQKLKEGDNVAVVIEHSLKLNFPERLQGRSGKIKGKKGRTYIVSIKDQTKEKEFLISPIHLKKLKQISK